MRSMRRMASWLCCAGAAACTFNVTPLSTTRTEQYSGTGFDTVAVHDSQGLRQVTIHGSPGATLQASANVEALAPGGTSTTADQLAQITFSQTGSVVTPTLLLTGAADPESTQLVGLTVQTPADVGVQYQGTSADLQVDGMTGALQLQLTSGNVHAVTRGAATVSLTSGDVTVDAGSTVSVQSTSGSLQVRGTGGSLGTTSGDIGMVWTGSALVPLEIHATSGSVSVTVPAQAGFHLQVDNTSGDIDGSALGVAPTDAHHVDTDVHGGGTLTLVVRTTSGSVLLTPGS